MVLGICGSLVEATAEAVVELCLECRLAAAAAAAAAATASISAAALLLWLALTAADPEFDAECIEAIVFILELLELVLEVPELVVLRMEVRVPEGLSVTDFSPVGGGLGNRLRSQPWRRAALGVIRVPGSHSRQRRMKSRNMGSSQPFSAVCSSRDPGGPRGLPRRDRPPLRTVVPSGSVVTVQYRGYPFELIKFFARLLWSRSF